MNIFKNLIFFGLFFMLDAGAMHQVRVESLSDTGKTVKLNIGALDGIKVLDLADISKKTGSLDKPKFNGFYSGKVVKIFPTFSYWYFSEIDRNFLKVNSTYSLQLVKETLSGRNANDYTYKVKVYESDKIKKDLEHSIIKDLPESIITNNSVEINSINTQNLQLSDDVQIEKEVDLKKRDEILIDDEYSEVNFLRNDKIAVTNQAEKTQYLNDLGTAQNSSQLKRITLKKDGLKELYYDPKSTNTTIGSSIPSVSDEYFQAQRESAVVKKSTRVMIDKTGPLWSADMNKDELQNYLVSSGIAKEQARRNYSMLLKSGNEFTVFLGSNLSKNYTLEDESFQNTGFTLGLSYELHLIRASKALAKYSFDLLIERGSLNIGFDAENGRLEYGLIGGHLNYYFHNYPHSRNQISAYFGIGMKRGNGELEAVSLEKIYDYEILALPSFQIGAKYRSPSANDYEVHSNLGFGVNFKLTYDMINVAAISSVTDDFDSSKKVNNLKADLGFSFFF